MQARITTSFKILMHSVPWLFIWLNRLLIFFFNLSHNQFIPKMSICWLLLPFLCSELQTPWKTRPARACVYKPGFKSGLDSLFQLSKWLTCSLYHSFLLRQAGGCAKVLWGVHCEFSHTLEADSTAPWRQGWDEDSTAVIQSCLALRSCY